MTDENKHCSNCGFYSAYYTRGHNNFYKKDVGVCRIKAETVSKDSVCKKWRECGQIIELRKQNALNAIPAMLNQLTAIAEILQEEVEREK